MTTTYIPPQWAVEDDAKAIPKLMQLYERVSRDITGNTRWLGAPKKTHRGEGRYRKVFADLNANLRQWGFDPQQYLRWVISTHPQVLDRPRYLNDETKLSQYKDHRAANLGDAVKTDITVRGQMDLIRTGIETDVEQLERWKHFMPDYKDRLLHLHQSLSSHFLASDTVFTTELMKLNFINREQYERVREVIVEFGHNPRLWEQVIGIRNAAIRVVAGK